MALSPSGQTVVTGSRDRRVRLWASATGQRLAVSDLAPGEGVIHQIAFAPDGRSFLTTSLSDPQAGGRLWEALPEMRLITLPADKKMSAIDLTRDGRLALTAEQKGRLLIWDVAAARPVGKLVPEPQQTFSPAQFTPTACVSTRAPSAATTAASSAAGTAPPNKRCLAPWRSTPKSIRSPSVRTAARS